MRHLRDFGLAAGLALGLAACVSIPAPSYQPSIRNAEVLAGTPSQRIAVGPFAAAKGVEDKALGMRGSKLDGLAHGGYASYLRQALQVELESVKRFDTTSPLRIEGTLTRNYLDISSASKGYAEVGAEFRVLSGEREVYRHAFTGRHEWDSSFIGAVAMQNAVANYSQAVQNLLNQLFSDPAFQKATDQDVPRQ
ncbi:MAG: hypothetical protein J7507_11755 [Pseudoxanthomonas sp.]|nr:hypothetical protein [Pseudoxanthomonas sp.]